MIKGQSCLSEIGQPRYRNSKHRLTPDLLAQRAARAIQIARDEGLTLIPSFRHNASSTGYLGVHINTDGILARVDHVDEAGERHIDNLGRFETNEEAALALARHFGCAKSAALAADQERLGREKEACKTLPGIYTIPPEQVEQQVEAARRAAREEGLVLRPSANQSGYAHVYPYAERWRKAAGKMRFRALYTVYTTIPPTKLELGIFDTPEEAALRVARYLHASGFNLKEDAGGRLVTPAGTSKCKVLLATAVEEDP